MPGAEIEPGRDCRSNSVVGQIPKLCCDVLNLLKEENDAKTNNHSGIGAVLGKKWSGTRYAGCGNVQPADSQRKLWIPSHRSSFRRKPLAGVALITFDGAGSLYGQGQH